MGIREENKFEENRVLVESGLGRGADLDLLGGSRRVESQGGVPGWGWQRGLRAGGAPRRAAGFCGLRRGDRRTLF